jgi:hypothetical protein
MRLLQLFELGVECGESLLHGLDVLLELIDTASITHYSFVVVIIV